MSSSHTQAISLYQLALQAERPPTSISIGPRTFRSVVKAFLSFLSSQQTPATLWVKLPRRTSWQQALDRYLEQSGVPHRVYCFERHGGKASPIEDRTAPNPSSPAASRRLPSPGSPLSQSFADADIVSDLNLFSGLDETALVSDAGMVSTSGSVPSRELTIPLVSKQHLQQEYFLLILSEAFSGLFLAHRPRSVRALQDTAQSAESDRSPEPILETDEGDDIAWSPENRKSLLLSFFSFDPLVLRVVLQGLKQVVQFSQLEYPESPALSYLLATLSDQIASGLVSHPNCVALSALFTQQVQQQELTVSQLEHPRQPSDAVTPLQLQNEELSDAVHRKNEFLKNMSQELRTPLSSMKTALTLLNSPSLKPAQRQRYMEMLSQACDRQNSLLTGVLDLLQLEQADGQETSSPPRLSDIVPGVVSTYQPLANEKGILLAYTIPDSLPNVSCPQPWLRQIVINLLHNGIKFTPSGGRVWVKAKQQDNAVLLEIQDTGVGINPADIPNIFEPFYRMRHPSVEELEGAGLGLTIAQRLITRCGGAIDVQSQPSQGSVFTVRLPIYTPSGKG